MTLFTTSIAQRLYKLTESTLSNIQYSYLKNNVNIYNKKLKGEVVGSGFYKAREKIGIRFVSISKAQKELKDYVREADSFIVENKYNILSSPSLQKFENILKMNINILESLEAILKTTITKNRKIYGYNPESLHEELNGCRARRMKLIEVRVALNDFIRVKKTEGMDTEMQEAACVLGANIAE